MLTFYDPITATDLEISEAVVFYLVKVYNDPKNPTNNTFRIQGLSASPDKLAKDPLSDAKEYWTIVIDQASINERQSLLFPDEQLIQRPLSLKEVDSFFQFNPNETAFKEFNREVRGSLHRFWVDNLTQVAQTGRLDVNYATPAQIDELVAVSRGVFAAEAIESFLAYAIQRVTNFYKNPRASELLVDDYFTPDHLLTLAYHHEDMSELLTEDSILALREHTITAEDLLTMPTREMRLLLIHPFYLNALRSKQTSIETLCQLTPEALVDGIANHFQSSSSSLPSNPKGF